MVANASAASRRRVSSETSPFANRCDVREVLRRRAQHRRSADVDHLDGVLLANAVARHDLREGIEVHAHQIERPDRVLVQCGHVVVPVSSGEDARMDPRVQRLDPPAEHLRCFGDLLDSAHLEAQLFEVRRRSARGDELTAEVGQPARELVEAGLVVDRDQGSQSCLTTCGSSSCSAAWILARSVSTVSPSSIGTGTCMITGPESIPSST